MSQDLEGSLTIKDVIDSDEGKYQCVAKNFAGTRTSEEGFLLMQGIPFVEIFWNVDINLNLTMIFF